jgi:DNA processing protein
MDLLTAVAASMLPLSRLRVAAVFKTLRETDPSVSLERVASAAGRPAGIAGVGILAEARAEAETAIATAASLGIRPVPWFDPGYPALLACTSDPPPVLWAAGDLEHVGRQCVAVVGSRAATPYALQVGRRLAAELAGRGIVVVSGLARGVDSAAHEGCLEAGGPTIAVTGCGLDRVYPAEHRQLAAVIREKGLLLSEFGPGAAPRPEHFPLRNRIISGISLGVVVVEANEKSGSLITAACALAQGRDVMAVPGSVLSGRNRGSHSLLKDGAKIVETADDVLEELGWTSGSAPQAASRRERVAGADPLLARMDAGEVYGLDDLVRATGTPASKLLPRLMELELLGYVEAPASGRFIKTRA